MSERDHDLILQVARELRRPVDVDPDLDTRVMTRVLENQRLLRPRRGRWVAASLFTLATAASVTLFVLLRPMRSGQLPNQVVPTPVKFVLLAPQASSVTLVGDFNDWNTTSIPMSRGAKGSSWEVSVPLPPGRYNYAFVVDGVKWTPDPFAPWTASDDFGSPNSVLTVGEASL